MSQRISPDFSRIFSLPPPLERLSAFQDRLGVTSDDFSRLRASAEVFAPEKMTFAAHLYGQFHSIASTRMILDHGPGKERMLRVWSWWYESFFQSRSDEAFLAAQWRSGLNHVAVGVDHRYISLAYAMARRFIHKVASDKLPVEENGKTLDLLDRFLDLCLLVETDAFITSLSKFDHEIIRGIAHQVRNPVTVIGGNVARLHKQASKSDPNQKVYETILAEAQRMERMVRNVTAYNEVFRREPRAEPCLLKPALERTLDDLHPPEGIATSLLLSPEQPSVLADPEDLRIVFTHLLQNSLENLTETDHPELRVTSAPSENNAQFTDIRIFNNGPAPDPETLERMFTPFYSTKALGTGFGLPIARLALRKNHGHLSLIPEPGTGATCLVTLPVELPKHEII